MDNLWILISFLVFPNSPCFLVLGCSECWRLCGESDCQDIKDLGHTTSGVYHVTPCGTRFGYDVYCDMETDGGGWLVFQRRKDGSEDFYRSWNAYEKGFGNISGEHWLGLIPLRRILSQGHYELRIDLENWENQTRYAKYNVFNVGQSQKNYKLEITGYSGDAGDSLRSHNGQMFSTKEKDNDLSSTDCASVHHGAWWFKNCRASNLNGRYYNYSANKTDSIHWRQWLKNNKQSNFALKKTEMKIRKV